MGFRFRIFLLILFCSFIKAEAQTVGVYGGTFLSNYNDYGLNYDHKLGPVAGIFINGFLKGQFNPGLDIQYSEKIYKEDGKQVYTEFYPFFASTNTILISDLKSYKSITDIKLDLEFTSPQEDTFVISFGLQPGIAYLQDRLTYSNSDLSGFYFDKWVPTLGGSGTFRRNYIFGSPLQLFFSLSAQGYIAKGTDPKSINSAFQKFGSDYNSFIAGYAKLGLAYKFN